MSVKVVVPERIISAAARRVPPRTKPGEPFCDVRSFADADDHAFIDRDRAVVDVRPGHRDDGAAADDEVDFLGSGEEGGSKEREEKRGETSLVHETPELTTRASASKIVAHPAFVFSSHPSSTPSCVSVSSAASSPFGAMSIVTRVRCVENFGTEKSNERRRGRSTSIYSPACSMSSPSRRSVITNAPPGRASMSTRTISPAGVAKRNLPARAGSVNASKTASGGAA